MEKKTNPITTIKDKFIENLEKIFPNGLPKEFSFKSVGDKITALKQSSTKK